MTIEIKSTKDPLMWYADLIGSEWKVLRNEGHYMVVDNERRINIVHKSDAIIVPDDGDTIAVWFSCGAASAIAAKMTLEKYAHRCNVRIINNFIKEEDPDNQRFLKDVEKWIGVKFESAINSKYKSCSIVEVFEDRRYMSGIAGAPCTLELKKKARYEWEIKNRPDWTILGFTKEEKDRFNNFKTNERQATIHILENITKGQCFEIVLDAGLKLPDMYLWLYPNANCPGCVKATSPTYWNHVRVKHPKIFQERCEQSRDIGVKLVRYKGKRIFLDELPPEAKGKSMKNMNFECGIFCSK